MVRWDVFRVRLGEFVTVKGASPDAPKGIGKLAEYDRDKAVAVVTYFDAPNLEPTRIQVPIESLRVAKIPEQSRVYWYEAATDKWLFGRVVLHQDEGKVGVAFPRRDERYMDPWELEVRSEEPIHDPSYYLGQQITESTVFYAARSAYTEELISQRGACQGMSGLIASVIELEPHQMDVVRRVLQDPVQRYLLADEVGLGKTIEAGVLIRQYVLDDPTNHRIAVIVPDALRSQWLGELSSRFLLGTELEESIMVVGMQDTDAIQEAVEEAGMIVIDEAHHLERNAELYEVVRDASARVPRLLLLSATPVLGNVEGYLKMLHLLDPLVFQLSELDAFEAKILNRQDVAEALANLTPENKLVLDLELEALTEAFPNDTLLSEAVEKLEDVLTEQANEDEDFLDALAKVKSHLTETYRLHRRILRNRRAGTPGLTPKRTGVKFVEYSSIDVRLFMQAFDRWYAAVLGEPGAENESETSRWFSEFIGWVLSYDFRASQALTGRLDAVEGSESATEALSEMRSLIAGFLEDSARMEALVEEIVSIVDPHIKVVVFCSDSRIADLIADELAEELDFPVDRHETVDDPEFDDEPWRQFFTDPAHRLLVCDREAEEGINLQGGNKLVVHYDLPMDANRIEQRMGRLDRFGSGEPIDSIAFRCVDNEWERAWGRCLDEGYGVFDQSIAGLQYLVQEESSRLAENLFREGFDAITELTQILGGAEGKVALEQLKIEQQDTLDALAEPEEDRFEEILDLDFEWKKGQQNIDRWLIDVLHFQRQELQGVDGLFPGDSVHRYRYARNTMVPLRLFYDQFIQVLDVENADSSSRNPLTYPYVYRRQSAMKPELREQATRLMRYGDPLLTGISRLTQADDRGCSAAIWRQLEGLPEGFTDVFFRFGYIVEADIDNAAEIYRLGYQVAASTALNAIKRRGDMLFKPFYQRVWVDVEGKAIGESAFFVEKVVCSRFEKFLERLGGASLSWKQWEALRMRELGLMEEWESRVSEVRDRSEVGIRNSPKFVEKVDNALNACRIRDGQRFAQLEARIEQSDGEMRASEQEFLDLERQVAEAMVGGIKSPKITLDSVMASFVSSEPLSR